MNYNTRLTAAYYIIKKKGEPFLRMSPVYVILIILAAFILLTLIWCLAEPFFLDFDRVQLTLSPSRDATSDELSIKKLSLLNKDINKEPDLRIFFFSDVHAEFCAISSKRICNALTEAQKSSQIDAVIFGGDIANDPDKCAVGYRYLNKISEWCKGYDIPFYGITGNHDITLKGASEAAGFTSLDNRAVDLTSRTTGSKIVLAGVSDSGRLNRVWKQMPLKRGSEPVILAAHNPDNLLHLDKDNRPDFMLSGHFHGGQMKLPFRFEHRFLRTKDLLPKKKVVEGAFDINGTTVFISRGLGCGVLPFRLFSAPEASVVEIYI